MLSFEIKKIKIGVSFSFFAVIAVVLLWQGSSADKLLVILLSCVIHELGHIFAMCLCSVPPQKVIAYGGGIKIYPDKTKMISDYQDILILAAGCLVNLVIACLSLGCKHELTYFSSANLFLGLFNLMPLKYFDGGRILSIALNDSKAVAVIRFCFIVMFGIVIAAMICNGLFSLSLVVTFAYILVSEFFT